MSENNSSSSRPAVGFSSLSMTKVLMHTGIRRLKEWLRPFPSFPPSSSQPLWLLGACYQNIPFEQPTATSLEDVHHPNPSAVAEQSDRKGKHADQSNDSESASTSQSNGSEAPPPLSAEVLDQFRADFRSKIWVTYRSQFHPLPGGITTDVGWGCTLRSGQMLLANAMLRSKVGRSWRLPASDSSEQGGGSSLAPPADVAAVLEMFADEPQAVLGIHRVIETGDRFGIAAGRWLTPGQACKSLASLLNHHAKKVEEDARVDSHPPSSPLSHMVAFVVPGDLESGGYGTGGVPILCKEVVRNFIRQSSTNTVPTSSRISHQDLPPSLSKIEKAEVETASALVRKTGNIEDDATALKQTDSGEGWSEKMSFEEGSGVALDDPPDITELLSGSDGGADTEEETEEEKERSVPTENSLRPRNEENTSSNDQSSEARKEVLNEDTANSADDIPKDVLKDVREANQDDNVTEDQTEGEVVDELQKREGGEFSSQWPPLLILVPVLLGMGDRVNECYIPLITALLRLPQSVGIVGGSPGSSFYFLGYQDDHTFYLDPHVAHPTCRVADPGGMDSYFCNQERCMKVENMDPSIAIGLLCNSESDFEDCCARLEALNEANPATALLTVVEKMSEGEEFDVCDDVVMVLDDEDALEGEEGWELL